MKPNDKNLPVYSLHNFSAPDSEKKLYNVELFDANRHFEVSYPHRHDFFEVLYIQKGCGYHVIDSNNYEIKPPCIFFLSPGQAHKLEYSNDIEGCIFIFTSDFYLLNFSNQNRLLEFPFFFTITQNNPPLQLQHNSDIEFYDIVFSRAIKENGKSTELLRAYLDMILVYSSSLYKVYDTILTKGKGHLLVKRFFQLVEENYHKNISINEYASMLAITPNHLTQAVKQLTAKTSNEIIQEKQMLEIKRLLVHTNMGVSEIANYLNFADQSYFTKFFKRITGVTPLRFRLESMKST
ncbi:MAG: helix-turn-helix transcriptional regulator [Paludibacteraceae bacterium]|nr:helix-turn-helix transcriptional regulator [Paludibacteraceae bacterium]MBN2786771.1 helix-turn-helix transcriptional regulator [Paludibacteraceae bacterium]